MQFFQSAVTFLGTCVVALGGGVALWGVINLFDGYSNDNPGSKSQGVKQLVAGGAIAAAGVTLVPLLGSVFAG